MDIWYGDPHLSFFAEWKTISRSNNVEQVENPLIFDMQAYAQKQYVSIVGACRRFFEEEPSLGYAHCSALNDDLTALLTVKESFVIKAHDIDQKPRLLALSPSQVRLVQRNILYSDMAKSQGLLNKSLIALEDLMQQSAKIESIPESPVPKERSLYLLGSCNNQNFKYTLQRYDDRLHHDFQMTTQHLDDVARNLDGHALYRVEKIPRAVSKTIDDFRRFLLTQYAGIKRKISREKLEHYPLLFANSS